MDPDPISCVKRSDFCVGSILLEDLAPGKNELKYMLELQMRREEEIKRAKA